MEYEKYEFCKAVKCECFITESIKLHIEEACIFSYPRDCIYTAKEFHKWLKENDFRIIKKHTPEGDPILSHTIRAR